MSPAAPAPPFLAFLLISLRECFEGVQTHAKAYGYNAVL